MRAVISISPLGFGLPQYIGFVSAVLELMAWLVVVSCSSKPDSSPGGEVCVPCQHPPKKRVRRTIGVEMRMGRIYKVVYLIVQLIVYQV